MSEQIGELEVEAGPIPYAKNLAVRGNKTMKLADFIDEMRDVEPTPDGPGEMYVFDNNLFEKAGPKFQEEGFPRKQPPFDTWQPEVSCYPRRLGALSTTGACGLCVACTVWASAYIPR